MDINDEDEDLDNIVDSEEEEGGSKLQDAENKIEDAKSKVDNVKDLVEKMKNNSNKSATPDGPTTKSSSKGDQSNNSAQSSNGQSKTGQTGTNSGNTSGNTSGTGGNTPQGGAGGRTTPSSTGGTGNGTAGGTTPGSTGGVGTGTTGGTTAGTGAGASSTAGASGAGATASGGASGAAAGGTAAGSTAAGSTAAAGGAAAGGAAAGGAAATAATPVGWVILIIIIVVLLIMLIIGFVSFFTDGLGLIGEQMLKFADTVFTKILTETHIKDRSEAMVKNENLIQVGEYLEEMGYDLEGFGFLDSNGKGVTKEDDLKDDGTGSGTQTGTRKIKNSEGKVILERKITKTKDGQITEGEITEIKSECIWSYLVAENKTYIIKNVQRNLLEYFIPGIGTIKLTQDLIFGDLLNDGMIEIRTDLLLGGDTDKTLKANKFSINRETNELIITLKRHLFAGKDKYAYSLDGWTGKYGKSLEFLLTLHLATMSPEFATEVAKNSEFDALVRIKFEKVYAVIRLMTKDKTTGELIEITKDNYKELGYTDAEWKKIDEYNQEIVTYIPYISEVNNHWFYKNIDFSNAYEEVNNPDYDKNNAKDNTEDKYFTYEYEYVGLGKDDDILVDKGLYVREIRNKDKKQIAEPKVTKREYKAGELSLQTMLLGGDPGKENTNEDYKYYIYNGSSVPEGTERDKRYIMQKTKSGENTEFVMDTRFFQYAFSILESVHSQDSEFVLRDLKELFASLGVDISGIEAAENDAGELEWLIPDYIPVAWDPMFNTTETEMKISAKTETSSGFNKDLKVVMPGDR